MYIYNLYLTFGVD